MDLTQTEFSIGDTKRVLTSTEKKKLLIAGNLGSFLEIFDFTVYAFFAATIGEVFFKMENPLITLLISVSVFATGFIMRPLGSIFIGGYCDRHGRKAGLFLAIMLMGAGTLMIALTPSYNSIGFIAPIIIVLGRLLQGFSAGGQIAAAGTLLLESAPNGQKGYFLSWQFIVQSFSSLFGGLFAYMVYNFLTPEQVLAFGWRLPFIFSLLIIPVGFYIRAHLHETHHVSAEEKKSEHAFKTIMRTIVLKACSLFFSSALT